MEASFLCQGMQELEMKAYDFWIFKQAKHCREKAMGNF
jgi:hypothetical protein